MIKFGEGFPVVTGRVGSYARTLPLAAEWRKRKRWKRHFFVEAEAEAEAVMTKSMEAEAEAEAVKKKSVEAEAEAEAAKANLMEAEAEAEAVKNLPLPPLPLLPLSFFWGFFFKVLLIFDWLE